MTAVYCYRENCINRSRRKSKVKNKRGETLYRCKKDILVIQEYTDGLDNDLDYSSEKTCECLNFADRKEY